jgi:hypothetical protein
VHLDNLKRLIKTLVYKLEWHYTTLFLVVL